MTEEELKKIVEEVMADNIDKLQKQLDALRSNDTIPYEIGEAFKVRVLSDVSPVAIGTKGASSENTSVVTGVAPTVFGSVLGIPDGFHQVTINGTTTFIPYYN